MISVFMIGGVKVNINAIARIFKLNAPTIGTSCSISYNITLLQFGYHKVVEKTSIPSILSNDIGLLDN
jgi:hypothetical protein